MKRFATICLMLAVLPLAANACRVPPHRFTEFRKDSFVYLPSCDGQQCDRIGITAAWYEQPTDRYRHGILGDPIEGGALAVYTDRREDSCGSKRVTLDEAHVFEDVAPRLADLDQDGDMEVITVRSHRHKGAQLAIWGDDDGPLRLVAATPYIGQANRWLAPLGAADLDGDGSLDVAYIDRPHLAKTLRIWRYKNGTLVPAAALPGFTNHRIGERDIAGGIRTCNGDPEMILATANWSRLVAITWQDETFNIVELGSDTSRPAFARAMTCSD